jgi:hypothetical protein
MKKWTFTMLIAVLSFGFVNAQITYEDVRILADFEGETSEHTYTFAGVASEALEIVDNPMSSDMNASAKVLKQIRESGSWNNQVNIMFNEPLIVGESNTLRVKVYSEIPVYIYMRPLDAEGNQIAEGWAASPTVANEWSYGMQNIEGIEQFSGVRLEFSTSWGNTGADDNRTVFIDEIEVSTAVIPMLEPTKIYTAKKTTETITIDGFDLEDNWLDIDPTPIENVNMVVEGQTAAPAEGSSFRALYDEEFLYLFIEITDNSPTAPAGDQWWNYDGIEIFIDGQGRIAPGQRLAGQYQLRINYNTETLSGQDGATVALFMDNGMAWEQGTMPGGYTFEAKLPWISILGGEAGPVPPRVSFDLSIADEDPAIQANRYTNVIWAGGDEFKHPYESSEFWGAIAMEGVVSVDNAVRGNGSLRTFPSPVNDYIMVEMNNMKRFEIISITGAVVQSGDAGSDLIRLDTQNLKQGMYFIRATNSNDKVEVQKIIKR